MRDRAEDIVAAIDGAVGMGGGSAVPAKSPKAPKERVQQRKALAPSLPPSVVMIEPFDVAPQTGSTFGKYREQVASAGWFTSGKSGVGEYKIYLS